MTKTVKQSYFLYSGLKFFKLTPFTLREINNYLIPFSKGKQVIWLNDFFTFYKSYCTLLFFPVRVFHIYIKFLLNYFLIPSFFQFSIKYNFIYNRSIHHRQFISRHILLLGRLVFLFLWIILYLWTLYINKDKEI